MPIRRRPKTGNDPAPPDDAVAPARPGRRRLWVAGGAVGVLLALALLAGRPGGGAAGDGRAAPTFTLPRLDDPAETVSLDPAGQPVVVNFWASWCVPCRREMPALQAVAARLDGRVRFLGVNNQDGRGAALDLVAETGITYPAGYDPEGRVARQYGLFGMPTTVFIDARGRIVEQRTGELSRAELEASIERAFGIRD